MSAASTAHAAHSDAYVGALERGRVVYAVADHADGQAALLIGFDAAELILRQTARAHFFNAEFRRDGVRGVGRIACQQHGRHAEGRERADHPGTARAQRVGQREETGAFSIRRKENQRCAAVLLRLRGCGRFRRNRDAALRQERCAACQHGAALRRGFHAPAGDPREGIGARAFAVAGAEPAHDGPAQRRFRKAFRRCGQPVNLFAGESFAGFNGHDFRPPAGERCRRQFPSRPPAVPARRFRARGSRASSRFR